MYPDILWDALCEFGLTFGDSSPVEETGSPSVMGELRSQTLMFTYCYSPTTGNKTSGFKMAS